jgi:hypothetical protein
VELGSRNVFCFQLSHSSEGLRDGRGMHQRASAMLVLVFAAVMLVTGLLYIERSGRPFESHVPASAILTLANEAGTLRAHR